MSFVPASPLSLAAFLVIDGFVVVAFFVGVFHAYRTAQHAQPLRPTLLIALGLGAWLGLISGLVGSGLMPRLPFHGIPLLFGSVLFMSLAAGFSPLGRRLADGVPVAALVAFHGFRLPLELVLHQWAEAGTIPTTMTWTGQNWDILAGVVALLAAPFAGRLPAIAWGANVVGAVLLLNVIRVAVMSSPLPFAWGQQPPLLLALHLPYAWIGPVCVGGALFGHVVLTRALWRRRGSPTPA